MAHVLANNLRQAVFQAAFSGQLTNRMPTDSNVIEYLRSLCEKRIEYEKTYKEKKHQSLWECGDFETNFDIPDEWEWAYVGDVFRHNAGKALNAKNTNGRKRKYITTSNVYTDHFELDNLKEMYYTDEEAERCSVRKGDLIVLEGGDCGRTALWNLDESYCIQNHLHRLRPFGECNIRYFFYLLSFYKDAGYTKGKGIAIQGLSANALHNIIIPVCSPEEQARIVARVDELMAKIDEYEKLENELAELKKSFPGDMKAAVLQAAMQGKLTEQLDSDSSVYETLAKIKNTKDNLCKAKVIKKDIGYEEVEELYDIPDNWVWTHVGKACVYAFNGKSPEYVKTNNGNYTLGQAANQNDGIHFEVSKFCSDAHKNKCDEYQYLNENDTLLNTLGGGSVGRVGIFHNPNNYNCLTDGHIFVFRTAGMVDEKYFFYYMKSNQKEFERMAEGSTNQSFLKLPVIKNYPFPLPPIEEQRRIVEKLDKILPLCEKLEKEMA